MPLTSDTRDWPCWFWFFSLYSMLSMLFQPFDAYDDHKTIYVLRLNLLFTNSIHQVATRMSCSFSVSFFIFSCVSLYLFLCLSLVLCVLTIVGRQSYHKSIFFRQKIPLLALNSNKRSAIDFFSFHGHFFAAPKQSIISLNLTASEKTHNLSRPCDNIDYNMSTANFFSPIYFIFVQ